MANTEIEQLSIDTIRTLAMDAVQKANSGHPGTAMALAPLAYVLYTERHAARPGEPALARPRPLRPAARATRACCSTRCCTSPATTSSLDDLKQFRQWGSRTPGHPECGHTAGVEVTTGPLGQGFANAVGMAIAERFLAGTLQPAAARASSTTTPT